MDVKEIAALVFQDAGLDAALLDLAGVTGTYEKRELCVQYDESEWDFLCRLLEDEGIYFTFRQDPDAAVMELCDNSTAAPMAEPDVLAHETPRASLGASAVTSWREARKACVSIVALRDHDPLWPPTVLNEGASDDDDPFGREHYEFPGAWVRNSGGG